MIHCLIFQIILENNGRVDVFDHEGRSALHLAAEFGSIEVCEALLSKNAFINSKAKTGKMHALKIYVPVHFKILAVFYSVFTKFLLSQKKIFVSTEIS